MADLATVMAPVPSRTIRGKPGRVLLIMPAFNEAGRLGPLIENVREAFPLADVLIVDDGSSDATAREALAAGASVARHPFNLGYGAALQTGYRFAISKGYDFLVQMDADGQHDPLGLDALLDAVRKGRADVAIGSRFLSPEGFKSSFARRLGSTFFGALASLITGRRVTDPTSGFWAMNRGAVEICSRDTFPHDFPDADVLIALGRAGLRIEEVPVRMFPRAEGVSMHKGLRPLYYVFKMTLSIFVELLRTRASR
jgi:glycosyltransferase involved in cell wall biosynthesis